MAREHDGPGPAAAAGSPLDHRAAVVDQTVGRHHVGDGQPHLAGGECLDGDGSCREPEAPCPQAGRRQSTQHGHVPPQGRAVGGVKFVPATQRRHVGDGARMSRGLRGAATFGARLHVGVLE